MIWNSQGLDAKTSYSAHRIQKGIEKVFKDVRELQKKLADKYAKKTKVGDKEILHRDPQTGQLMFDGPEQEQAFYKAMQDEIEPKELKLEVSKLHFNQLAGVRGISPNHWAYLGHIVEGMPGDEPEEKPSLAEEILGVKP